MPKALVFPIIQPIESLIIINIMFLNLGSRKLNNVLRSIDRQRFLDFHMYQYVTKTLIHY